jgi:hypothetical protein
MPTNTRGMASEEIGITMLLSRAPLRAVLSPVPKEDKCHSSRALLKNDK